MLKASCRSLVRLVGEVARPQRPIGLGDLRSRITRGAARLRTGLSDLATGLILSVVEVVE